MAYIDTSVLVAYYCPEPLSKVAERAIRRVASPTISPLVEVKFCSALAIKVRTGEMEVESARRVLSCFHMHCADSLYRLVPIGAGEWISAFTTPLRTADALHLAAAFANSLTLLTADANLAKAAKHFGVECKRIR